MNRRHIIWLIGGTLTAWPIRGWTQQQAKLPVVGVLAPHLLDPDLPGFVEQLRELGYEDGRNIQLLVRSADGRLDRLPQLAAELVAAKVDVIVAFNTPGSHAAINASTEIPIVMGMVGNPVATGLVSNLSRPGGNVTGVSNMSGELAPKRLQVLKEVVPAARRIALMFNPDDPITAPQIQETKDAARQLELEAGFFPVRSQAALSSSFQDLMDWRADAALWLAGQHHAFIKESIALANRHRLPTMVVVADNVRAGGLVSYYPDQRILFRRVADYVDKILKGAKPGDLPVEQPTVFRLTINLITAKQLGLTISPLLLTRADEVIE